MKKQNLSDQIHQSNTKSDYIDWTINLQSSKSSKQAKTINNQLDAINFLQECLENRNSHALIDIIHKIAQELNIDQHSYSAKNNNHLHLTPMLNSNIPLSNNKEKKNKLKIFI